VVFTLLESQRNSNGKRLLGVGFASFAIHTAIVTGIAYATLHAAPRDDRVRLDTTVVLLVPQEQQKPAEPPPVQLVDAVKGFQTVVVPAQIPTPIPPIDLQQRFDPRDYSGSGIEGGRANGIVVGGTEVYAEAIVEERPELLSAPPPVYPPLLRQAGIQGRVVLRAIVDTTGRVEPTSVRIVQSPSSAFEQPTKDWVLKALFRPARMHGRAVRVFINLPVDYSLKASSGSP
jgi:protein TonB